MPEPAKYRYDVFISYSHEDEDWVCNTLLLRLEGAGLCVCIDYRDFMPGKPALFNMQDAVRDSRFTLLVLTPNWVKSEWTLYESLLARTKDPAGLQRRTVPLRLQACDLPEFIAMITWVDFTRPDRLEIAWTQLLTALGTAEKSRLSKPANTESQQTRTRPPAKSKIGPGTIDKTILRKRLLKAFDRERLAILCADINMRLERDGITDRVGLEIVGGSGLEAVILNLIDYLDRRGLLPYLLNEVRGSSVRLSPTKLGSGLVKAVQ